MQKKNLLFTISFILFHLAVFAQGRIVKGTVRDSKTNEVLPGVGILVEGTATATTTDVNGAYSIKVEGEGKKIIFSYVGYTKQIVPADKDVIDVALVPSATVLGETVVTALGVSREKKSLGYATQEISGDKVTDVKSGNFVNQLSGKVAGVRVKNSANMGGSTNIIIRGATSINGNNQALFVVDGVPINNDVTNTVSQTNGRGGFDYGSPISDIDPENIESINVLKGAAATALYGSRAARGVVIITTKKGRVPTDSTRRFGVTINSNVTMGMVDKSTFPKYQNEYGAGYGPFYDGGPNGNYFFLEDVKGDGTADDLVVPYTEDASLGGKFDPNLMIYQWDAFVPGSPNYHKATPWVSAGKNGPISFFNKSLSTTNGFALDGGSEKSLFRLSYSNSNESGILPNSTLKKNNFGFNGGTAFNDKFSANVSANFTTSDAVGRNSTGYNDNIMTSFRQWMETNVNYQEQKSIYEQTKANYSWNPASSGNPLLPIYWNNPYFERYENYEDDQRNRFFGNTSLNYKVNDLINLTARMGVDQYSTIQEERLAMQSASTGFGVNSVTARSGYSRFDKTFRETNLDLMANFKKDLNQNFNLSGLVGSNVRRTISNDIFSSTNGGLIVPGLYALSNSANPPLPAIEHAPILGVNGFFANASLGYKRFLYLDVTARQDYSSTLPAGKNHFFYPGVSGSFIFSEKLKLSWLDFGKVRLNHAVVGNDAPFASIKDVYAKPNAFGSIPFFSLPATKNNPDLLPEKSSSTEAGLEMMFFKKRLGFDFAAYNTNTINQILSVAVSTATGYANKFVNAGKIQNKGLELSLYGSPVRTKDFDWTINLNYALNRSKVIKLFEDVTNLQMGSYQGGVTLNATVGEPLGTLKGSDFVYLNGKKVVGPDGYYKKTTTTDNTLGNINPRFTAGISNTFTYKNLSLSFLVDMQQGGSLWDLDLYYGMGTGLYPETAGKNDLGNPKRDPVVETSPGVYAPNSGGIILDGVQADGTPNKIRVNTNDGGPYGYNSQPNAGYIYDASYIKLREVTFAYKIPMKKKYFFTHVSVGLVGSNLWIIHKNLPYADPEAGAGSGNIQGFHIGVMPTVRTFGFNLMLQF